MIGKPKVSSAKPYTSKQQNFTAIWLMSFYLVRFYIYIYVYIPTYPHAHMEATSWSKHWRSICPNPLKRYPPDLCLAISRMVGCAAPGSATTPSSVQDGVYLIAEALQCGYDPVTDGTHGVDAADFCDRDIPCNS